MKTWWGALLVGAALIAGALLRLSARRKAVPPAATAEALGRAVRLAGLCREARALAARKAWAQLDAHLVAVEEAALGVLEALTPGGRR